METPENLTHIKGWGIDADPENEPTYPMKHYTGDDHKRINWERPPLQPIDVEVLHSTERPNVSAVFGNTLPPKGLSGRIRRFAFKHSENEYSHWLPLILADRVDTVEGIIDDIKKGHFPNVFKERGWNAEWKYNRPALIKKLAAGALASIIIFAVLSESARKKK